VRGSRLGSAHLQQNPLANLPDETVIDGEIVALDEDGRPSFNSLQNYGSTGAPLHFFIFDVLILKGKDVMGDPVTKRRELIEEHAFPRLAEPVRYSPILDAALRALIQSVKAQGLEGLVAKRADGKYEPGLRSGSWQKVRVNQGHELVIAGYTPSPKNLILSSSGTTKATGDVCREDAQWVHAGLAGRTVQEDQTARS